LLKLQVVFKFRLLSDRAAAVVGAFDQLRHALLRGTGTLPVSGVVPAAMKSIISS